MVLLRKKLTASVLLILEKLVPYLRSKSLKNKQQEMSSELVQSLLRQELDFSAELRRLKKELRLNHFRPGFSVHVTQIVPVVQVKKITEKKRNKVVSRQIGGDLLSPAGFTEQLNISIAPLIKS